MGKWESMVRTHRYMVHILYCVSTLGDRDLPLKRMKKRQQRLFSRPAKRSACSFHTCEIDETKRSQRKLVTLENAQGFIMGCFITNENQSMGWFNAFRQKIPNHVIKSNRMINEPASEKSYGKCKINSGANVSGYSGLLELLFSCIEW